MTAKLGTTAITGIKLGTTDILSVKLGTTLAWSKTTLFDNFNRANGPIGSKWTDHGPSSAPYQAYVNNGGCRINIPDGLIALAVNVSSYRYNDAQVPADDGYIEVKLGDNGNSADFVYSSVWRRIPNSSFVSGVGIRFCASQVSIVKRISSTTTVALDCGSFAAGDIFRLVQVGNLHSLYRNGTWVGEWDDVSSTVAKGSGFRSIGLVVSGSKDLFGARRFSASFDYIEAG